MEFKSIKLIEQGVEGWWPGAGEWVGMEDVNQRLQTVGYKVSKFQGSDVQHGDYM